MAGRGTMPATRYLMCAIFTLLLGFCLGNAPDPTTHAPIPPPENIITMPFLTLVIFWSIAGLIFMGGCIAAVVMVVRMTGHD